MKVIIDRFEGEYAVVEYEKKVYNLPKLFVPVEAKEGDVLEIGIAVDQARTEELKEEIAQLMQGVWEE